MGYPRAFCSPETYLRDRGQTTQQTHANSYYLLGHIISRVTGTSMSTVFRPLSQAHDRAVCIDPVGVIILLGKKNAPIASIEMMVNFEIQLQEEYVNRLICYRDNPHPAKHAQALEHIQADDTCQTDNWASWIDQSQKKSAQPLNDQQFPNGNLLLHNRGEDAPADGDGAGHRSDVVTTASNHVAIEITGQNDRSSDSRLLSYYKTMRRQLRTYFSGMILSFLHIQGIPADVAESHTHTIFQSCLGANLSAFQVKPRLSSYVSMSEGQTHGGVRRDLEPSSNVWYRIMSTIREHSFKALCNHHRPALLTLANVFHLLISSARWV